ncbi:dolichyl-P-Man:Man(7)GlcNAc(2)-PP-dolichol alpha-1,6-mannosyltransferase [Coelomomyces lativittatus]|nr:dolichyl-P-Man:Man(7)GlcNAc(2)-PP-dolichol alpha-1,6-mannosyltransferase [Coelomomyces lativittatus]KAJ1514855.1 dolichyl-P-Man:Man(7)GlcNAc(2)-PP-dolichol alpha-1,6-mannosyltransferase [Coelomomyces lativittatus]KAJ1518471.1 dolichyl-P-Man:Man(7)GlcNAc(2)-PP-dolichol alpha-1,6-mannosyltransferase [Coelomomyces lativittatus]
MTLVSSIHASFTFLLCMIFGCILLAPYTKVEESFNTQACHDFLFLRSNFKEYDHHAFPGVVERTFLGSFSLAMIVSPLLLLLKILGVSLFHQKWIMLHAVRMALGFLIAYSHLCIAKALPQSPKKLGTWYLLLTGCQFYSIFWTSRLLPNTFALFFSNLALSAFLHHLASSRGSSTHWKRMVLYLTFATSVFRCEVLVLSGCVMLQEYVLHRIPRFRSIRFIVSVLCVVVPLSVLFDSWVWGYWTYPEFTVFVFNTYLNQSGRWGVSPFHSYFTFHLPKLLSGSSVLAILGGRHQPRLFFPAFLFVFLYSFLPHKETRFISYVLPYFTVLTVYEWTQCRRWVAFLVLFSTCIFTGLSTYVSIQNYPGGHLVHALTPTWLPSSNLTLHLDDYTTITGTSWFVTHPAFHFSKADHLSSQALAHFDARVMEWKNLVSGHGPWNEALCVSCYQGLSPFHAWLKLGLFRYGPCVCLVTQTFSIGTYPEHIFQKWTKEESQENLPSWRRIS